MTERRFTICVQLQFFHWRLKTLAWVSREIKYPHAQIYIIRGIRRIIYHFCEIKSARTSYVL